MNHGARTSPLKLTNLRPVRPALLKILKTAGGGREVMGAGRKEQNHAMVEQQDVEYV